MTLLMISSRSFTAKISKNTQTSSTLLQNDYVYILSTLSLDMALNRRELGVLEQFWYSISWRHLWRHMNIWNATWRHSLPKWLVMTSNDVREERLECHMTSNDVRGECYIIVMTGRCVNKPVQSEPVSCYENTFISNFTQLCK